MKFNINFHSFVDVITNSSTVIYTTSDGCVDPFKDLVNEVLKLNGSDLTCDDIFVVLVKRADSYSDRLADMDDEELEEYELDSLKGADYTTVESYVNRVIVDIANDIIPVPSWMECIDDDSNSGYSQSTLEVITKDPKYDDLAEKLVKFLYSTDNEATRD